MPDIVVKQGCRLSPTLFGLHIDDFETYLEENNGHTPCLFNTNILTLLCVADVVMPLCQEKKKTMSLCPLNLTTLKEKAIVGVICWELKSYLFMALVLPTFTYGIKTWRGDLKGL